MMSKLVMKIETYLLFCGLLLPCCSGCDNTVKDLPIIFAPACLGTMATDKHRQSLSLNKMHVELMLMSDLLRSFKLPHASFIHQVMNQYLKALNLSQLL